MQTSTAVLRDSREQEEFWSETPALGWRAWQWTGQWLRGVREVWPSATHTARCQICAEPPGWNCSCGIYAVKEEADVPVFGHAYGASIIRRVELSGLVIEHEHGYRAAQATILELIVDSVTLARQLEAQYPGVTVHRPAGEPGEFWSPTPVTGWRCWSWRDGLLVGGHGVSWVFGRQDAQCDVCTEAPGCSCSYGIYAFKDLADVPALAVWRGDLVIGKVGLYGLVIEHERGYRAGHARIIELFVSSNDTIEAVASRYPGITVQRMPYNDEGR